jgi:hypothetical protein
VILAMIIGYLCGSALAFYASRRLLRAIGDRTGSGPDQRKWITLVGGLFGAISLAPAIFLAMMVGGVLGGRYDSAVSNAVGLGDSGDHLVLALRVALVTALTVACNAAVGGGIGLLMARALQRDPSIAD